MTVRVLTQRLALALVTIAASFLAFSQTALADTVTFSTPGVYTYTVPPNITSITVGVQGGGGNGEKQVFFSAGGGGGGGAYAQSTLPVTPGRRFIIVVGAGGTINGQDGEPSSFGENLVAAAGGQGGQDGGGIGGQASASTGTVKFSGGNGGTRQGGTVGAGGGGGAGTLSDGGDGGNATFRGSTGGIGGVDGGGPGGYGTGNNTTTPGAQPGGGGGGAGGTGTGAPGGNGQVTITTPTPAPKGTIPTYVEYTGSSTSGARMATASVLLDRGDVFKLNTTRTGYNYVNGFTLWRTIGWCNHKTPKKPGYWCGVTPLPVIPGPIKSFKQNKSDPPECTITNPDIFPISSNKGGAISAIVDMKCSKKMPAIFTWTQLGRLMALGGTPITKAYNAESWVDTANPQPPPGVVYSCDSGSWITRGNAIYKLYIDDVIVAPDGHLYQPDQYSSDNFVLHGFKKRPVCA